MIYGYPVLRSTQITVNGDEVLLMINDRQVYSLPFETDAGYRWAVARMKVLRESILDALMCHEELEGGHDGR